MDIFKIYYNIFKKSLEFNYAKNKKKTKYYFVFLFQHLHFFKLILHNIT